MIGDMRVALKKSWIVVVLWIMSQGCYSLIDINNINPITFSFGWILIFLILYPKLDILKIKKDDPFNLFWISFVALLGIEIFQSWITFSEPIIVAVKQLIWLIPYVLYFPVKNILSKSNNYYFVENKILGAGLVACLISYILYFTKGKFGPFTGIEGYRDGNYTMEFCYQMTILSTWIVISRIFSKSNRLERTKWVIIFLFLISNFLIVMRYRAQAIGVIVACIIAFSFSSNIKRSKKILILIVCLILVFLVDNPLTVMFTTVFDQILNGTSTFKIRLDGYAYFLGEWRKHPLLGFGGLSLIPPYRNDFTARFKYYLSDVGIIGWIYKYGIAGLIFYGIYIKTIIKCTICKVGNHIRINYFGIAYLGYRLCTILTLMNIDYAYKNSLYIDILAFALLSVNYEKTREKYEEKYEEKQKYI